MTALDLEILEASGSKCETCRRHVSKVAFAKRELARWARRAAKRPTAHNQAQIAQQQAHVRDTQDRALTHLQECDGGEGP